MYNEVRGKHTWADSKFNALSLCPNCHTRMKVGGYDLTNILILAEKIKNDEYTAEYVPNRPTNMGYEIEIDIAGKPATIFFSKDHMENIVNLLRSEK
ncbi:hypothetical protein AciM339_1219 [Aciduliprofundum sp. MAR08-339]|uniref:hypothetical protein n=1 Tax=Aciduliprofundum sp. (strain MAR08-339) TaxID=673860 RepID=UPI0002A4A05F|nr:hypothetical protein AciM339_1219 [Aciduliprofundum sp. MAR08-339]